MTNNSIGFTLDFKVSRQTFDTVSSFKYLGSIVSNEGSKQEDLSRIAQTTCALTQLKSLWTDRNFSLGSKVRLLHSSVISVFLYGCKLWTLTTELQRMEMRCYRRLLGISYTQHKSCRWLPKPSFLMMTCSQLSLSCKALCKEAENEGDKRKDRRITSRSGLSKTVWAAEDKDWWTELVNTSSVVP